MCGLTSMLMSTPVVVSGIHTVALLATSDIHTVALLATNVVHL